MSNDNAVKVQLQQRLADLLPRVGRIQGDLRSAHDRDWPERANELQNDEVLEGLDEMALGEVRRIHEALERIDGGTYGVCARCGQPIGTVRLTAVPTAVTFVRCAVR